MRQPNFIVFIILCSPLTRSCWSFDEHLECKKFDGNSSTFAGYCAPYIKIKFEHQQKYGIQSESGYDDCEPHLQVKPNLVLNLGLHGCDNRTVQQGVNEFHNLVALDISYSNFQTMDSFGYEHAQVEQFNMSHNAIIDYKWMHFMDLLARFPKLQELDLSYNNLQAVHTFVNRSIIKLQTLHFQYNSITYIQRGAFVNLTELERIDFSHNKLNRIFASAFSNAASLHAVHMEHNPIEFFECEELLNDKAFKFAVHISWEHVEYFNTDCVGIDVNLNQLKSLVRTKHSPTGLYPSQNRYQINCDDQSFKQIRAFKAGPNKYRTVLSVLQCFGPELDSLDLSGNLIQGDLTETFQPFAKLTELSLSQTKLVVFDFEWLQMQKQLVSLDISHNSLISLENVMLSRNLHSFETLTVAGNNLGLSDFVQQLPDTLKNLDVSNCRFEGELIPELFERMPNLEELYLRSLKGQIFINVNPFEPLANLIVLDISHNELRGMDLAPLASTLQRLREFRAADCHVNNAIDLINAFGMNLWTLDLSGNYIGNLHQNSPLRRLNLYGLFLNRADISTFDLNTLSGSSDLAYFEIAHNLLKDIDLTPLSTNVMELKMQNNQLQSIIGLTPEHFNNLRYINIGQNELPCDYLIEFAKDFSRKNVHFEEWDKFAEACLKTDGSDGNRTNVEADKQSE